MNQGCVIEAVALQELYSALQEQGSCVTASIQMKEKAQNINGGLAVEAPQSLVLLACNMVA